MKSRTILKSQYDELGSFLCQQYVKKHQLREKKEQLEKDITNLLIDNLPDLVQKAYHLYPSYFKLSNICVGNIQDFVDASEKCLTSMNMSQHQIDSYVRSHREKYKENAIKFGDCIYDKLTDKDLIEHYKRNYWYYTCDEERGLYSVEFQGISFTMDKPYPQRWEVINVVTNIQNTEGLVDLIGNYIIEIAEYNKFKKSISCAFGTITTTNMLKNELPEAYEFFYEKYGEKYEKEDELQKQYKSSKKKVQCDAIEGLRASIS